MQFEFWWLLAIPLFFGLGWFAARLDLREALSQSRRLPDSYFRGLNFLLNEQPDKAIDAFVDVVRLDPETIELHFALGNLFRRRGETDRAIRVHQNLLSRSDLDTSQREHALYSLALDFMKAGLLDRAEDALNQLAGTSYGQAALEHRLELAQMVRDWPLAIELAHRLGSEGGPAADGRIAHFHCELAQAALAGSDADRVECAAREVDAALKASEASPRAWLLRSVVAAAQGDAEAAVQAVRKLAEISPEHVALAAPGWLETFAQADRAELGLQTLEQAYRLAPSVDVFSALMRGRERLHGREAALAWARAELSAHPSMLGLDALFELSPPPAAAPDELRIARTLVGMQTRKLSRYVCGHCGFKARQYYWQCPGCSRWDTYQPRRGEELEARR